jgi:hypothetical protein
MGKLQDIKLARVTLCSIEVTLACVISHPLLRIYCMCYNYTISDDETRGCQSSVYYDCSIVECSLVIVYLLLPSSDLRMKQQVVPKHGTHLPYHTAHSRS